MCTFPSLTVQQKPPLLSESFGAPIVPASPYVLTYQQPPVSVPAQVGTAAVSLKEDKEEGEEEGLEEDTANFPLQDVRN